MQHFSAILLVAAAVAASTSAFTPWRQLSTAEKHQYSFEHFKIEFNRTYASAAEESNRRAVFEANLQAIRRQNAIEGATWRAGVNKFTDLTREDMRRFKGKVWTPPSAVVAATESVDVLSLPTSIDWREKNVVSPVKNQEACGSCWAFSTTETVESAVAIATGTLLELAPQELVDCVTNPDSCGGTGGCGGATQELGFAYVMLHGMGPESAYPYKAHDGECLMTASGADAVKAVAGIKGYVKLPTNDQTALLNAVGTVGPIAISVDAAFGNYESGVYDGCSKTNASEIDHAVQAVGYGTENGSPYWLVRNSWGADWGDHGYIKLARSLGTPQCYVDPDSSQGDGCKDSPKKITVCGECGILSDSSYPTGAYIPSP